MIGSFPATPVLQVVVSDVFNICVSYLQVTTSHEFLFLRRYLLFNEECEIRELFLKYAKCYKKDAGKKRQVVKPFNHFI